MGTSITLPSPARPRSLPTLSFPPAGDPFAAGTSRVVVIPSRFQNDSDPSRSHPERSAERRANAIPASNRRAISPRFSHPPVSRWNPLRKNTRRRFPRKTGFGTAPPP